MNRKGTIYIEGRLIPLGKNQRYSVERGGFLTYYEIAPSGILVSSTVPFVSARWWDSPWLHIVWSWHSWVRQCSLAVLPLSLTTFEKNGKRVQKSWVKTWKKVWQR